MKAVAALGARPAARFADVGDGFPGLRDLRHSLISGRVLLETPLFDSAFPLSWGCVEAEGVPHELGCFLTSHVIDHVTSSKVLLMCIPFLLIMMVIGTLRLIL